MSTINHHTIVIRTVVYHRHTVPSALSCVASLVNSEIYAPARTRNNLVNEFIGISHISGGTIDISDSQQERIRNGRTHD